MPFADDISVLEGGGGVHANTWERFGGALFWKSLRTDGRMSEELKMNLKLVFMWTAILIGAG